ncbi:hypothetical protein F5B19DRAFT_502337 [Rostrohypoxylon terebratum]|nr:hypothetical protein F5B19DRAFT_502337 [Rostrohypoxylon terebratum]
MAGSKDSSSTSSSYTYMRNWSDDELTSVDQTDWGQLGYVSATDLNSVTFSMVKGFYIKMAENWDADADGVLCFMRTRKWSWPMISSVLERPLEKARDRFNFLTEFSQKHGGIPTSVLGQLYFLKMRRYPAMLHDIRERTLAFKKGKHELDQAYARGKAHLYQAWDEPVSSSPKESNIPEEWLTNLADINDPIDGIASLMDTSSTLTTAAPTPTSSTETSTVLSQGYTPRAARAMHSYRKEKFRSATRERIVRSFAQEHGELRRLRPSDWEDDMETKLLAVLEARDRGTKWQRLSAAYANMTGVTIHPRVLEWRFQNCDIMDREESARYFRFDVPY